VALALPQYETDQLISLIGSKRPVAQQLKLILRALASRPDQMCFLDPFCGSSVVSRIARNLGMQVHACDLEPFSFITSHVYLSLSSDDLMPLFSEFGGLDAYLSMLNLEGLYAAHAHEHASFRYLSRYYAPQSDESPDGNGERLFFTAANARFLDTVRQEIENAWVEHRITATEKAIILASILYESSRKANTSGTFTAYHKRGPLRSRIVESCTLRPPVLPDASLPVGDVSISDAAEFVKKYQADICFLDPPSSPQQYGSAYHLLNTITLWDHYTPSQLRDAQGNLVDRSGIRKDWNKTKSPFCSQKDADAAFVHLLNSVDARHIVLTYPRNGIVSAERIYELLSARHTPVSILPLFKPNQGGRQAAGGKNHIEQVFITGSNSSFYLSVDGGLELLSRMERLDALTHRVFRTVQHRPPFHFIGGLILDRLPSYDVLDRFSQDELDAHIACLEQQVCLSADEAMSILYLACINAGSIIDGASRARLEKRLFQLVRQSVEEGDSDQVNLMETRFNQLFDQLGEPDTTALHVNERLHTFLRLAYHTKQEALSER
jgi:adenine-specific DNA-methyltransferase